MSEEQEKAIVNTEEAIKTEATAIEAKDTAEKTAEPVVEKKPKKLASPKLFFKPDEKIEITINGYHSIETGDLVLVLPTDDDNAEDALNDVFQKVVYKFWFTRVTYDKLNRYRTRSMIYNSEDQNNTINELRLREFMLVYHLVDWNLQDEKGEKIPLKFDTSKALSNESLELIYTLPPNLVDVMLVTYEKKMSL